MIFVNKAASLSTTGYIVQDYGGSLEVAFSLRKLSNTATNCIRIREDGGDTETDIGFSGDDLDAAAIASHCGANLGYVVKWYDQSGNGVDVSQSSHLSQPKIYDGSSVRTDSEGNYAMYADGAGNPNSDYLWTASNILSGTGGCSAFLFFEADSGAQGAGNQIIRTIYGSSTAGSIFVVTSEPAARYSTRIAVYSETAVLNPHTLSVLLESSGDAFDTDLYINGALKTRTSGTDGAINFSSSANLGIFNYGAGLTTTGYQGYCSEILIYSAAKTSERTEIESNIDDYWIAT